MVRPLAVALTLLACGGGGGTPDGGWQGAAPALAPIVRSDADVYYFELSVQTLPEVEVRTYGDDACGALLRDLHFTDAAGAARWQVASCTVTQGNQPCNPIPGAAFTVKALDGAGHLSPCSAAARF